MNLPQTGVPVEMTVELRCYGNVGVDAGAGVGVDDDVGGSRSA